jgi:hypothetical protein
VYSAPRGAVIVIEPAVGSAHVGSVDVVVTVGALAGALIVTLAEAWQLPATLLAKIIVYDPAPMPLNIGDDWKLMPSILYVYSAPSGAVIVIDPAVGSAHVGSDDVVVIVGALAGALMVTLAEAWQLPATYLTIVIVYDPAPMLVNVGEAWKLVPSIEYVYSAPSGAVTVIEPAVGSAHVGSVDVVVTVGAFAGALIVTLADAWQLPATLLATIIVYDPAPIPLNIGDDWKLVPSMLYVYSTPSGAVTVIDPAVGSAHVGSVDVLVTVGALTGALIVILPDAWQLPATLLTTVTV